MFSAFTKVRLIREQRVDGAVFPEGTIGTIAQVFEDGSYGVEFFYPVMAVIYLDGALLESL